MTLTNPIENIPSEELKNLTEIIQKGFGTDEEVVSVSPVGEGANQGLHLKAYTNKVNWYGLKAGERIQSGMDKEWLAAELGILLDAPNACRVIQVETKINFPPLEGKRVNITQWLQKSESLNRIPKEFIKRNLATFFLQFGEWSFFALLFGITDRHSGNWVWNNDEKRLSLVDMEESFVPLEPNTMFWAFIEYSDPARIRTERDECSDWDKFSEGLRNMSKKFHEKENEVRELLGRYDFSRGYSSKFSGMKDEDILSEILMSL